MDGRQEAPDWGVQASVGDTPWKTVGYGWSNEDGSILFGIEWSGHVKFMLVKAADCVEGPHEQD